ncbi:MAG: class I SAM-dependent methyltransferase [Nostoc sp.]|uniref:class I SAM-dependent methyltransferase n=1 Tax=Nostoc sp. TaxID=1180 RepID=UPI002FF06E33
MLDNYKESATHRTLHINQTIENIYSTGTVVGQNGEVHKLHSAIDREEGEFLSKIIHNDPKIIKTLEVGCAYGLSSLHICLGIQERVGASHTIIDPFQYIYWDGVGIRNLDEAGIDFFDLIQVKSEFALPRLLEEKEGQFDLVFIDGWHTFDHTLIDAFYASRLLRVGGYLVVDDVSFPAVKRVIDFLKNYPCYEEYDSLDGEVLKSWKKMIARRLMSPINQKTWSQILLPSLYRRIFDDRITRIVALQKTQEDTRNWKWHNDAF